MVDLEKLSQVNYSNAFNEIKSYFSKENLSRFDFNTATIASAYILLQLQRNSDKEFNKYDDMFIKEFFPGLDEDGWFTTNFMDYFFDAEETLFDKLKKLKGKYSDEVLMALILFADCNGRYYETGYTPQSVFSLALKLLGIKPKEQLLHISSCSGENYRDNFNEIKDLEISAFDNESDFMGVSALRSCLLGKQIHYIEDPRNEKSLIKDSQKNIFYDLSIFRKILNEDYLTGFDNKFCRSILDDNEISKKFRYHCWVAVAASVELLKKDGKAVAVIPVNNLSHLFHMEDRRIVIQNRWVETVISLPDRMFLHSRYPMALVVFSKNNKSVRFIDAHEMGQIEKSKNGKLYSYFTNDDIEKIVKLQFTDSDISREVNVKDVIDNDCELNPVRYFMKNEKLFGEGIRIGSVVHNIVRGKGLSFKDAEDKFCDGPNCFSYLTSSNIQDGILTGKMTKFNKVNENEKKYLADVGDLVICKNGPPFKVAYIGHETEGTRFYVSDNLYIIKVDKNKIHPLFLKAFLESDEGNYAIRLVSTGARIQTLSVKGLKDIRIPDVPMERQLEIVQEYETIENQLVDSSLQIEQCRKDIRNLFDYNFAD